MRVWYYAPRRCFILIAVCSVVFEASLDMNSAHRDQVHVEPCVCPTCAQLVSFLSTAGEYLGGAVTCDAHHMTEPHPDGRGVVLCLQKGLKAAGVTPDQVNYVNAHATSTLVRAPPDDSRLSFAPCLACWFLNERCVVFWASAAARYHLLATLAASVVG